MPRYAGHSGIRHFSSGVPDVRSAWVTETDAFYPMTCAKCNRDVHAAVIATYEDEPVVRWLRCPSCGYGAVTNWDVLAPSSMPGEDVDGLPGDVKAAFTEARSCIGVGAYTAGELMCRKILMHIAVDKGASEGKTFAEYLTHLESAGYLTATMKPWVDQIRKNGNVATHEIPTASKERSFATLAFTIQLLRLVYEMAYRASQFTATPQST